MRLINAEKLIREDKFHLESFPDERNLDYAILSHRWEENEVLFEHVLPKCDFRTVRRMKGFYKIKMCCQQALAESLTYVWVDTCCIDKSSSAELQEAINSMFRWYSSARVCFAYLSDVFVGNQDLTMQTSQWFKRGWTLQELVAPEDMYFYDQAWQSYGSRQNHALLISETTGIREEILKVGFKNVGMPLVSEIMSWARGRQTTRVEDRAYSLMGLFGVNMAMLYGEGENAFRRLQEEIIRNTEDQSVLYWQRKNLGASGHLAVNPDVYPAAIQFPFEAVLKQTERRASHTITNQGISVELELIPWGGYIYLGLLNYYHEDSYGSRLFEPSVKILHGIMLRKVSGRDTYIRVEHEGVMLWTGKLHQRRGHRKQINITKQLTREEQLVIHGSTPLYGFQCHLNMGSVPYYGPVWAGKSSNLDKKQDHWLCNRGNVGYVAEMVDGAAPTNMKNSLRYYNRITVGFLDDFVPCLAVRNDNGWYKDAVVPISFEQSSWFHPSEETWSTSEPPQNKRFRIVSRDTIFGGYIYEGGENSEILHLRADPELCTEYAQTQTVLQVAIMSEQNSKDFLWVEIMKPTGGKPDEGWQVLVDSLRVRPSSVTINRREQLVDELAASRRKRLSLEQQPRNMSNEFNLEHEMLKLGLPIGDLAFRTTDPWSCLNI